MKKYSCIAVLLVLTLFISTASFAGKSKLNKIIEKNSLSRTAIVSVSLRDVNKGKVVYQNHSSLLLHPASTLKAFTTPVDIELLGKDNLISTGLYSYKDKYYLKLSGDPLLTTGELNSLFDGVNINGCLYIDDTAIDDIPWGVGWMWDDAKNPYMPKYNAYNLNGNLVEQNDGNCVPVDSPEENFMSRLAFKGEIKKGKVPEGAVLIKEISHTLKDELNLINKESNNLAAETILKLASGGTTEAGLKAFDEFYSKLGADTSELYIVDGSGVSHNDLIETGWMTLALTKLYKWHEFDFYRETLKTEQDIWYKTGTLAGISGRTGYIKTKSGKIYAFAILIQNFKGDSAPAKALEDDLLKAVSEF